MCRESRSGSSPRFIKYVADELTATHGRQAYLSIGRCRKFIL